MDAMLSATAGVVHALVPFAEAVPPLPMGPQKKADPRDFLLMAQYLPTLCIRAASNGEVCIAAPANADPSPGSLTEFAEPAAVCGECGLSRARAAVAMAPAGATGTVDEAGQPSHPLFAVAAAAQEPY